MVTFEETQQRVNDCVASTRCDKRTLATITKYFLEKRGYVISLSELVRLSLETLEDIITTKRPDVNVLSTEEADNILSTYYKVNLHPRRKDKRTGRKVPTYHYSFRKQLDLLINIET